MRTRTLIIRVEYVIDNRENIKDGIRGIIQAIPNYHAAKPVKTWQVEGKEEIDKAIEEAKEFIDIYNIEIE